LASGVASCPAQAAPAYRFAIAPNRTSEALIDLAVQAGISIGGGQACNGRSPGLKGEFTLDEALRRLLKGADCRFEIVDARTVRLLPGRAPARVDTPWTPPAPTLAPVSELLVTATKRGADPARLAASISVVSRDQLETTGAVDAAGAVHQIAGVIMTNLGSGRDKILLRGLSDGTFTGRARSTVGTYLDNVPITYNAPDPALRLTDVEDIEVVRGPQGALYGSGSLSGIYRIVTRKPQLDVASTSLGGLAGWTESGAQSWSLEGVTNVPLIEDRAALRLVAYSEVAGGYLDDVNLRLSDVDRTTRDGGRAALRVDLNEAWSVTASATIQRLVSADTQYRTVNLPRNRRANRVRESHRNDFSQAAVTVTGTGDWGQLQSSTALVHHDYDSQYDASAALSVFGASTTDLGVFEEAAHIDMLVQDMVLTSPDVGPLRWLVGVYGSQSQEQSPSALRVRGLVGPPQPLYQEARSDRLREVALYGEASYELASGWTASAGARVFRTQLRTSSDVVVPFPGQTRSFTRREEFHDWSPKFSLQYEFDTGDLVYALASEGYRAGGFNSGGLGAPGPARQKFAPDRLRNFEVGGKFKLFDRRLDLRTALFYDLWTDIQTDQYLTSGLAYTANVGDARNLGLEGELTWRPLQNLTIQANALFASAKVTRVEPSFAASVAAGLPGAPDVSGGLLATYEHSLGHGLALLFTGEAGYVGRSRLTFDPTLSPLMGGYVTGKLSAQLRARTWRLAAFVSNPTNAEGDTFAYGNPFSFGQVRQVTPQRPRTLSLVLSATF
jgi:iron complex outermembrane receptor protein